MDNIKKEEEQDNIKKEEEQDNKNTVKLTIKTKERCEAAKNYIESNFELI